MAGASATVFSTGRGSPVGSPVMPVVKLTGNPHTYAKMPGLMDFNAGVVVDGADIGETGRALYNLLLEVAGGRPTRSEENRDYRVFDPLRGSAVAGWRVGRRDMPGEEGGNPFFRRVSSLLPGPPPPTFPRLSTGGEAARRESVPAWF
ncbi:MAG: hypothetical protein V8Q91_18355 [Bilophila wadsworthia]|uniref:hypothetical protein n=1 Tax=Bilophila wadsworthia TaxID=35833 RepID=UPI00300F3EDB